MIFVETTVFTRRLAEHMSEEDYRDLQETLLQNPARGSILVGGGGIRKLRWGGYNRGKQGGNRVIYYLAREDCVLMLFVYSEERPG